MAGMAAAEAHQREFDQLKSDLAAAKATIARVEALPTKWRTRCSGMRPDQVRATLIGSASELEVALSAHPSTEDGCAG